MKNSKPRELTWFVIEFVCRLFSLALPDCYLLYPSLNSRNQLPATILTRLQCLDGFHQQGDPAKGGKREEHEIRKFLLLASSLSGSYQLLALQKLLVPPRGFPWQSFGLVHNKFWGTAPPRGKLLLEPKRASFQKVPEQGFPASCSYTSPEQVLCH